MAIREFKISGVFGVVHELSTPSKLLPLLPAALLATLTFKLYIVNVSLVGLLSHWIMADTVSCSLIILYCHWYDLRSHSLVLSTRFYLNHLLAVS